MNQTTVFHADLWSRLRSVQTLGLCDACKIGVFSETYDAIHSPAENYAYGSEIACRVFTDSSIASQGYEILAQSEVPRNSTWVALPLGTSVKEQDRIRITKRQNAAITPNEDWEVASPVTITTTAVVVRLRPVDDYIDPS
jgi:hypothetical protein